MGDKGDPMNILDELMQLSPAERLDIAKKLWEASIRTIQILSMTSLR